MNNPLKYSNCWEDSELLFDSLSIDKDSRVLSIASAGDNSLYLLKGNPAAMTCVDTNPVQICVTQLKESALRTLSYGDCLKFLGFREASADARMDIYSTVEKDLSEASRLFFTQNEDLWLNGIIDSGKFEKYFQLFSSKVLPLIHSKGNIEALFSEKTETEQGLFYRKRWNNRRWRFLLKIFFSRLIMGRVGREPEKMAYVEGSVSTYINKKAADHLSGSRCQKNYMLQYMLLGQYGYLPPYIREENFKEIKQWLLHNRIEYLSSDLMEALESGEKYNRFNLSNIFEYMEEEQFIDHMNAIYSVSPLMSRLAYWNLMVPRITDDERWCKPESRGEDLGFFYSRFNTLVKC